MSVTGSAAITLRMLEVTGSGGALDASGSAAVTLQALAAAAAGAPLDAYGAGAATLKLLVVTGRASEPVFCDGAVTLKRLGVVALGNEPDKGLPVAIHNVTGRMTAAGGCLLEFDGPANRGVEWSIAEGSGSITALTDFTDAAGRAWARYDAGGYSGPLTIEVDYGA